MIHSRTEMLITLDTQNIGSLALPMKNIIKSAIRPKLMQYLARPYLKKIHNYDD